MTISELENSGSIIFECISGSKAYGLDTEDSDTDIRGVFVLPKDKFYSLEYISQVNDETNDTVYYELKKFIELLAKNNPNALELINMPEDKILHKDELFDLLTSEIFVSKLCKKTFVGYAKEQLKRVKNVNKKINKPMDIERKTIIDFCYISENQNSIALSEFLSRKGISAKDCGLVKLPHMDNFYGLYYSENSNYKGIISSEKATDIKCSPITKEETPIGYMYFNKNEYSSYCKEYKSYLEWDKTKNEERYKDGVNYDTKNMMHTFRLLDMAKEIGETGKVNLNRPNREYLLDIKAGKYNYDELMAIAEEKIEEANISYAQSDLIDKPNMDEVNEILVEIRDGLYGR